MYFSCSFLEQLVNLKYITSISETNDTLEIGKTAVAQLHKYVINKLGLSTKYPKNIFVINAINVEGF